VGGVVRYRDGVLCVYNSATTAEAWNTSSKVIKMAYLCWKKLINTNDIPTSVLLGIPNKFYKYKLLKNKLFLSYPSTIM